MSHLDEMTGLLYLEGELDVNREREVSTHRSVCAPCRRMLQALERESIWLRESLAAQEEAIPQRLARVPGLGLQHRLLDSWLRHRSRCRRL